MEIENGGTMRENERANENTADENRMRVIMVRPGEKAEIVTMDDSLESMQKAVGGLIEEYMPFDDDVALVCNEEGKISGLDLNRAIYDENNEIVDIIAGDFFLCYAPIESEKFLSLPDDMVAKYETMFRYPENFFMTGDREIYAVKYDPCVAEKELEYEER